MKKPKKKYRELDNLSKFNKKIEQYYTNKKTQKYEN